MHKGSVGWDELDFDEQDNFIRAICSNDIDYQGKAIAADIEKADLEGLTNLIVAASLILERKSVIHDADQWDEKHKDCIIKIFQGTLLGQRLETIFLTPSSPKENDPPQIFSTELKRVSSFEQYDEMAQLSYEDFKSFSSYILTSLPCEEKIKALENNFSNPEKKYDDQLSIMAAILYELPKAAYYETYEANEFSQGLIKSHEAQEAIQHLKEIGLVNFVTTDQEPYYDIEQNTDDALQDEFIIWLSERGNKVGLSKNVKERAQSFLAKRQTEKDKKQATFDKRTAEARLQRIELQKKIDKDGGWIMQGLYHGGHRVRARRDYISWAGYGWKICETESDLIKSLNTDRISDKVHHIDLRKKYGLFFKDEIAPVTIEISEYGKLDIKRTDEWGEGAKTYIDKTSWHEKVLEQCTLKNTLFNIGLFPCLLGIILSERVTTKANRIIFFILLIIMPGLSLIFSHSYRENDSSGLMLMIATLYASTILLPFWYNGFQKQSLS